MKQVCAECNMNRCVCDMIDSSLENKKEVNNAAANAIFESVDILEEDCREIVRQIVLGKIPNIFIKY